MSIIVEKSKKVLDFSLTLFMIHFMACVFYNGVPGTWDWWIIHVLGTIMMVLMGGTFSCARRFFLDCGFFRAMTNAFFSSFVKEYLCSKRELDDIPLLTI